MHLRFALCGLIALATLSAAARGNLINNFSFETPSLAGGPFNYYYAGDTSITGWSITGDSVDIIGSRWVAHQGVQSLDVSGVTQGGVYQDLTTIINDTYRLTFWMAGNPEGGVKVKTMIVKFGGINLGTVSFDTTGATLQDMKWKLVQFDVVAPSNTSRLEFISQITGPHGPAIDEVTVEKIPEPTVLTSAGLALLLLRRNRYRKTPTAHSPSSQN